MLDEELPMYYACSGVLVLPSKDRSEGFGLTILEANATGKPAIGSSVGRMPSVIQDGYNGSLVPPNDPAALAQAIHKNREQSYPRKVWAEGMKHIDRPSG
jgi:glycosyltransferase involved in cell wall biosynthesis